jgi:pimeloyl-ACP methyl ester carboxylesterase
LAQSNQTTVTPLADEDFSGACHYEITLPQGNKPVRAVWVIFDRGRDITKFYSDAEVVGFARREGMALMLAHQCAGKNAPGGAQEMDMDPSHGVGRALFTALSQFAQQTGHPEISSAKIVLLGFSGTSALFAHFVGYAPDRVVAAVLANPAHYDPVGIDNVYLPAAAVFVPELIIAGGADKIAGTQRPYDYFRSYGERGAPWAFVLQNKTLHCCVTNAKPLILLWLSEVMKLRASSSNVPLHKINIKNGWLGSIRTCPSQIHDTWGNATWDVCDASIEPARQMGHPDQISAGWFPSHKIARAWLAFIREPEHPTTSLP